MKRLYPSVGLILLYGLLAVLAAASPGITSPALAQQPPETAAAPDVSASWSLPLEVGAGWFPDITADASGRVHIAWSSSMEDEEANATKAFDEPLEGFDLVMYSYTDDGRTLAPANDIIALPWIAGGSEVTRPALLVGMDGLFHMTYRDMHLFYDRVRVDEVMNAQAWKMPYPLGTDQVDYFSRLAVDSSGTLHMVYTENVRTPGCEICYHIYYRTSSDNGYTWSYRTDISRFSTGAAKPQILVDSNQNIHVVWEAGLGGAYGQLTDPTTAMYAASYDGGVTWTTPREFAVVDGQAKHITIGEDGVGNLVVAYLVVPEDLLMYSVSLDNGRTWIEPAPIPGVYGSWRNYQSRLDDYSIARDSFGYLHLVFVGRLLEFGDTLDVLHMVWNGLSWSVPDQVTSLSGDVPEWPRIAVNGGNQLHVVWFVRDEANIFNSDVGVYRVFYSNRLVSAAQRPFIEFPTPTAANTPTAVADLAEPTPTPVDPQIRTSPVVPGVGEAPYTETDEMLQMGKALLPALVVIALMVGAVYAIRRR